MKPKVSQRDRFRLPWDFILFCIKRCMIVSELIISSQAYLVIDDKATRNTNKSWLEKCELYKYLDAACYADPSNADSTHICSELQLTCRANKSQQQNGILTFMHFAAQYYNYTFFTLPSCSTFHYLRIIVLLSIHFEVRMMHLSSKDKRCHILHWALGRQVMPWPKLTYMNNMTNCVMGN